MPARWSALIISSRPDLARWSGKKPRFPTITPMVIFLGVLGMCFLPAILLPAGCETVAIENAQQKEQPSPPGAGMKMKQDRAILRRMRHLVQPGGQNQPSVHQQRKPDEEPDRDCAAREHGFLPH